jgi:hypothetical protein
MTLAILTPVILFIRQYPVQTWSHPMVAPAAALSVIVAIYMVDNLLNAMINPIFLVIAGGISGLAPFAFALRRPVREKDGGAVLEPAYAPRFL